MPPAASAAGEPLRRADTSDLNRLSGAAAPLFALAARLHGASTHPDPPGLFQQIAQEIRNFEAAANAAGAGREAIVTARYALCTLLDEIVLNTPWGSQSVWASQTLLNVFHREGWGGEKFFQILERLLQQPAANLDLLEVMYLCMAMGLQGKYRIHAGGRSQLEVVQSSTLQAIRAQRGAGERELSPHWIGVQDARPKLARYLPLWVVGAASVGTVLVIYLGLLFALNRASDPVALQVAALGRDMAPVVERRPAVAPRALQLSELLRGEIDGGLLEVREESGVETVVLREGLFASGSAEVIPSQMALIESVASALNQLRGKVVITGHTDDQPIRTLRFPSNWQLSEHRADAVRDILARIVPPARLVAEPRADTEPLVRNDSPTNRALNRRVEIALLAAPLQP
jgi:type VI secretion system protein ImpK